MQKVGWACVLTLLLAPLSALADPPATSSNRFLFIIDVSSSMKKHEEPLRDTVFDLVYSGVRGYMTNGDSYGVWFAGETNDTSSAVETWKQKYAVELATRVTTKLQDRGCRGRPALDAALADARQVARAVGDVTVIIISSGETPLRGTPFDAEINAAAASLAPQIKQAKSTVNVTLAAVDGEFAGWAANSPDYLINMPALPPRKHRKAAPSAAPAVVTTSATNTSPNPPPPRISTKPIIITRDTVDREKQALRSMASTVEGTSPISATSTPPVTNTQPATNLVTLASNSAAVVKTTVPAAIPPAEVLTPEAQAPAAQSGKPATSPPAFRESANLVAAPLPRAPKSSASIQAEAPSATFPAPREKMASEPATTTTGQRGFGWLWAAAGSAATLLIWSITRLLRRDRSPETSLVTRAMALERLQRPPSAQAD